MVVGSEVSENYYSENESDTEISDNEESDEELALNQEIEDSQKTNPKSTPSISIVHETYKTPKLTTDTLDSDNIVVNQENDSVLKTVRSLMSKGKFPHTTWNHDNTKAHLATQMNLKKCLLTKKHN